MDVREAILSRPVGSGNRRHASDDKVRLERGNEACHCRSKKRTHKKLLEYAGTSESRSGLNCHCAQHHNKITHPHPRPLPPLVLLPPSLSAFPTLDLRQPRHDRLKLPCHFANSQDIAHLAKSQNILAISSSDSNARRGQIAVAEHSEAASDGSEGEGIQFA